MEARVQEGQPLEVQITVAAAAASLTGLLARLQAGENPLVMLKRIASVAGAYQKVFTSLDPVQVGLDGMGGASLSDDGDEDDGMRMSVPSRSRTRFAGVAGGISASGNPLAMLGAESPIAATMLETMLTSLSMVVRVQMREKLLGRLMEAREGKHEDLVQLLEAELRLVEQMPTPSIAVSALGTSPGASLAE